jgi:hypothetical protein
MNGLIIVPLVLVAAIGFAYGWIQRNKREIAERRARISEGVTYLLATKRQEENCENKNASAGW